MRCNKIRELLLTDYRDGELDPSGKAEVENHLNGCAECRDFRENAATLSGLPLRAEPGGLMPGPEVWGNISVRIYGESWQQKLAGFLSGLIRPMPLLRAAFVISLVLVTVVMVHSPARAPYDPIVSEYLSDQMALMSALGSGDDDLLNGDSSDFEIDLTTLA